MPAKSMHDTFGARGRLTTAGGALTIYRLQALANEAAVPLERLPVSVRVLLEALLRSEDGHEVRHADVLNLARYLPQRPPAVEVPFKPARVLLQDFTGVPAVVDLAAMRSAMSRLGGDPQRINPIIPVDLVIDHSVQVDAFARPSAEGENAQIEFARNAERYAFLRWGQQAFRNFRVVPPQSGICHQVNLEYLGEVVCRRSAGGEFVAFPDSVVGTDSHTPMINGLGVVGWGVGGIEAEAVMLGQPLYMLAPAVIGFKLTGTLPAGATATDLVLTVTEMLRRRGVVGKFVEFYGAGLASMTVPDRATIANMAPEYGATMGYFPVDEQTLTYLRQSGRPADLVDLVERYHKEQGLFRRADTPDPEFEDSLSLDLGTVRTSLAGPKRPQDRVTLDEVRARWAVGLTAPVKERGFALSPAVLDRRVPLTTASGETAELGHGAVVIAAITSCTNTSNPAVMLAAGILAKKAVALGLHTQPWVKTSLAPGSTVVTRYLKRAGLLPALEALGFHVVGYGCTTCIGNSGPLPESVAQAIDAGGLVVAAVLSGNRNFEGRIHPQVKASYLASPPLVVAYALAGSVARDLSREPIGQAVDGRPIYLADIWPSPEEIAQHLPAALDPATFRAQYDGIENANPDWNRIPVAGGALYDWQADSTYIQEPPFFVGMTRTPSPIAPITGARVLVYVGDSVTTDHISPAGSIAATSPAGIFLRECGVAPKDFNSYGARRGNDRVMTRGTFANIRLKNATAPGTEGNWTTHWPTGEVVSIFEAATRYKAAHTPTVVLGGKDYGMGSSRDWAAKGTFLLGVRAVLAESFERIHRSNLVGMGVLPLQFRAGESAASLGLSGRETFGIDIDDALKPGQGVSVHAVAEDGTARTFETLCRIDTPVEVDYFRNGGILHTVLRRFAAE